MYDSTVSPGPGPVGPGKQQTAAAANRFPATAAAPEAPRKMPLLRCGLDVNAVLADIHHYEETKKQK